MHFPQIFSLHPFVFMDSKAAMQYLYMASPRENVKKWQIIGLYEKLMKSLVSTMLHVCMYTSVVAERRRQMCPLITIFLLCFTSFEERALYIQPTSRLKKHLLSFLTFSGLVPCRGPAGLRLRCCKRRKTRAFEGSAGPREDVASY